MLRGQALIDSPDNGCLLFLITLNFVNLTCLFLLSFYHKEIVLFGSSICTLSWLLTIVVYFLFFKDNLLHCLKMLNNVTLSRNNFEHFPTGPPKQLAAVQVGLLLNLGGSCWCVVLCFKDVPMRRNSSHTCTIM